jgi:hypothetical protein
MRTQGLGIHHRVRADPRLGCTVLASSTVHGFLLASLVARSRWGAGRKGGQGRANGLSIFFPKVSALVYLLRKVKFRGLLRICCQCRREEELKPAENPMEIGCKRGCTARVVAILVSCVMLPFLPHDERVYRARRSVVESCVWRKKN